MYQINYIILDTLYKNSPEEIQCDFELDSENFEAKGIATITREKEEIHINGNINDCKAKIPNNSKVKVIKINANDLPPYFQCKLTNFPKENMRNDLLSGVEINFPKVKISSTIQFGFSSDWFGFEGDIQPLFVQGKDKIMIFNLEENK